MSDTHPPVLIAGRLPGADLPTTGERPALVMQAQALAREQGALVIAWPRWDMAVITPAVPPLERRSSMLTPRAPALACGQ